MLAVCGKAWHRRYTSLHKLTAVSNAPGVIIMGSTSSVGIERRLPWLTGTIHGRATRETNLVVA